MRMISKILLGTAAAASVATAGIAYAAPGQDGAGKARPDITRAQAEERAGKMFDRMDANKDGKLDAADREARQQARFDRLDTNKDGHLVRGEVAAWHERQRPQREAEMRKRFDGKFAEADLNKDGKLSRIEVDEKMPRLAKRFAWMDDNRDGFLSRAELEPRRHR